MGNFTQVGIWQERCSLSLEIVLPNRQKSVSSSFPQFGVLFRAEMSY